MLASIEGPTTRSRGTRHKAAAEGIAIPGLLQLEDAVDQRDKVLLRRKVAGGKGEELTGKGQ